MERQSYVALARTTLGIAGALGVAAGSGKTSAAAAGAPPSSAAAVCQANTAGGPVFITEACTDPLLDKPYVDVRRRGSITDPRSGLTVHFTYVHGGFTGANAKFAFYFPDRPKYKGRFFETTYPTLGAEDAAPGCPAVGASACSVVFALSNGAYVVSTNNNGGVPNGGVLAAYRTNAAAAKYSRTVAAQLYRTRVRPRGYLYGASGGGYQTVGAMENTSGVWDGGVPMVFGVPNAIPSFFTAQLLALRVVGDKLSQVADAVAPGGSGDPYVGLDAEQRSALQEATRLGMPLRGWWQYKSLNAGGLAATGGMVRMIDPAYVTDFWTQPGYEGAQPSVRAARIQQDATVTRVDGEKGLILASAPSRDLVNADVKITSGPNAGKSVRIDKIDGVRLDVSSTAGVTPGTSVQLDNSWLIALQYYQRHQVPPGRQYGWDQYRDANGVPLYPQRKVLVGPILNASTAGSAANGRFHGKMIMVGSTMDVMAHPWSGDWYRQQAQARLGSALQDNYRLWFMDHADHGPDLDAYAAGVGFDGKKNAPDHIVGYLGEVEQALLDLDAWVAKGERPPETTHYRVDADNQVRLADAAGERRGVQPIVSLRATTSGSAGGGERIEVKAGETVTFSMSAETPPRAGKIVRTEWDFEGVGAFTTNAAPTPAAQAVKIDCAHVYRTPGVYFAVVRVTSQREGKSGPAFGLVQNLAAARVVVR